jgi:hypothetical protein
MTFKERLVRLLDRGEVTEPAPDSVVELEDVWLHEGPRLLQVLEHAGIQANGVESSNVATEATAMTRMRIFVRYEDLHRAKAALDEHRQQLR